MVILDNSVKQEYKHFRHSQDDSYLLWRAGGTSLIVVDLETMKSDELIYDFWKAEEETKPISAVSTSDANKIVGVSIQGKDAITIHYYEKDGQIIDFFHESAKKILDINSSQSLSRHLGQQLGSIRRQQQSILRRSYLYSFRSKTTSYICLCF